MKRLGFALIVVVVFGVGAALAADSMPVTVTKSVRAPIGEEIRLTGNLTARRVSMVSSEVDGIVSRLPVDDGDAVKTGDLIVQLDDELARIALSRANAQVAQAHAEHRESIRRFDELTELVKKQHVPETNVAAAKAAIDIALAGLRQAQTEVTRAEAILKRHRVYAPFDGVIGDKIVEVGQWVETSGGLVELVETGHLRLDVPVPQFYFSRVRPGTEVAVRFDAIPNEIFAAAVTHKIPVSDNAARTFPARIDLQNEQGLLAPGMSANVTLRLSDDGEATALLVPQDAVVHRPDGTKTVWTITIEDGVTKALPKTVTTGRVYRDNVEILNADFESGTQVVVRGNEILRPGQPVSVAEESPMDI